MPWLAGTIDLGTFAGSGVSSKFYYFNPAADFVEAPLPTRVSAINGLASGAYYNVNSLSRMYMTGLWTDNVVFTENFDLYVQGILAPTNQIVNTGGTGSSVGVVAAGTGITGSAICYIAWWDDRNKRRSPLSGPSPTIALTNQGLSWTNLPTGADAPQGTTHIELFRAMNGNAPRLAVRRDIGTTAVTESIATALLGEAITEDLERFPRCRFNAFWHDRQALAGDDRHPDRIYLSPLNDPENYGGLYLTTRRGERVVGLIGIGDFLVVLCPRSSYVITGYTEDDIKMDVLEPAIGAISHNAIVHADNYALVPSHRGLYVCTGAAMHFVGREFQNTWREEFAENESAYANAWGVNDIESNTYKLWVGPIGIMSPVQIANGGIEVYDGEHAPVDLWTGNRGYWAFDYTDVLPETGGGYAAPKLSLDLRHRTDVDGNFLDDFCAKILMLPGGTRGRLYTGSANGYIRVENVVGENDDGDVKPFVIRTGHNFFNEPGGTPEDGFSFEKAWMYMPTTTSYDVYAYAGDENTQAANPPVETFTPATELDADGLELEGEAVHVWDVNTSGRGIGFLMVNENPSAETMWHGYGGNRIPGITDRKTSQLPVADLTTDPV